MVKPTPHNKHTPYSCIHVASLGNWQSFNFTAIKQVIKIPSCLPINKPPIIPTEIGVISSSIVTLVKPTPAFAKANSGNTKKAIQGCKLCSIWYDMERDLSRAIGINQATAKPAKVA